MRRNWWELLLLKDVHGDILISKGCLKIVTAAYVECFGFSAVVKTTDVVA